MNGKKRGQLREARALLLQAANIVSQVLDDEQYCLDNIPENLQSSEKYEHMETTISKLEDAVENIETAEEYLNEASE